MTAFRGLAEGREAFKVDNKADERLAHKKNIAGADDVVSLCYYPGLEQPPHPGASETDAKVSKKMNLAKRMIILTRSLWAPNRTPPLWNHAMCGNFKGCRRTDYCFLNVYVIVPS